MGDMVFGMACGCFGLCFGTILGAWLASRIESLPKPGRLTMKMRDIRQRAKLREWMSRSPEPLVDLRRQGEPEEEEGPAS